MSEHKPWPLLAALDELLARDGWQEDDEAIDVLEQRVADETGIAVKMYKSETVDDFVVVVSCRAPDEGEPFEYVAAQYLRSRDAAAMLEEAVMARDAELYLEHATHRVSGVRRHVIRYDLCSIMTCSDSEPAARTRAALEAGWRLGIWPRKTTGLRPEPKA